MHTRESLELIQKRDGHSALRDIGHIYGAKSTSSDRLIMKILEKQNDIPIPSPVNSPVEFSGFEGLTDRKRNLEKALGMAGDYFPSLVPESKIPDLEEALKSFAHQWNFNRIEFFLKFQAFRLYKDGKHVDWINLNEVVRRYNLKFALQAALMSRRMYTKPDKRAYQ